MLTDADGIGDFISRRRFLSTGVVVAAGVGVFGPVVLADEASSAVHEFFAHAVASGDPLPDAVVLWTRVTPAPDAVPGSGRGAPTAVEWDVATDRAFTEVVLSGRVLAQAASDHTVKVDARGLTPATTYWYRFRVGEHTSPIGRTRTAPAPGSPLASIRVGVVSCANWQAGYFSAYRHLADADVDVVVHLGDYLYEYQPGMYSYGHDFTDVRRHDPPRETVSLADYRQRHAQYKTDPDLALLHSRVPFIVTWDDHEIADGWWPGGAFEHQSLWEGTWRDRRAAAQQAYDEWMPVRLSGTARIGDGTRIYRRFAFGGLFDLAMLDLRGYRDPRVDDDREPGLLDPSRSITGAAQGNWLVETLADSTARWKLVGNPVMIAPMLMPARPQVEQLALVDATDPMSWGRPERNTDQWDGYPADRRRLLEQVAGVPDVVFLSGDVHTSWANEVPGPDGASVAVEFVCPSVTSNNCDDYMGTKPRSVSVAMEEAIAEVNPHVDFVNLDDHGYCVLELTDARARMDWFAVSDRRDPHATAHRLATRFVRAGSASLSRS